MSWRTALLGAALLLAGCAGPRFADVGGSPFISSEFSLSALESGGVALVHIETAASPDEPYDQRFASLLVEGVAEKLPTVRLLGWAQATSALEKAHLLAEGLAIGETPPVTWQRYGEAVGARYLCLAHLSGVQTRTRGVWGVEVRERARPVIHERTSTRAGAGAVIVDAHTGQVVWQVELEHLESRTSEPLTQREGPMRPGVMEKPKLKYEPFVESGARAIVERLAKAARRE